jgi:hypothetical protein
MFLQLTAFHQTRRRYYRRHNSPLYESSLGLSGSANRNKSNTLYFRKKPKQESNRSLYYLNITLVSQWWEQVVLCIIIYMVAIRPEDRLSKLRLFVVFSVPYANSETVPQTTSRPLPSTLCKMR